MKIPTTRTISTLILIIILSLNRLSFGWHRAEVIGALVSVLTIWVVTAILVYLAVLRVVNQDFELEGAPMLITSAFGILVNIM